MLIKFFFSFIFSFFSSVLSVLPDLPNLDIFNSFTFSEFSNAFTNAFAIISYFLPCQVVLSIIAIEIAINTYLVTTSVFYRIKHSIPFL